MEERISKSDPDSLARLLGVGTGQPRLWDDSELGAILRHQLTAPVQFDLSSLEAGLGAKLRTLAEAQGLVLRSFADLLTHPNPPVELLEMVRQFAKSCRSDPESSLPRAVAEVLYLSAIAAAFVRRDAWITRLDKAAVKRSIELVLAHRWLDRPVRDLFEESLRKLS